MYAEASVLLTQVVWKQIQLVLVCFPISILIICYTPESRQKKFNDLGGRISNDLVNIALLFPMISVIIYFIIFSTIGNRKVLTLLVSKKKCWPCSFCRDHGSTYRPDREEDCRSIGDVEVVYEEPAGMVCVFVMKLFRSRRSFDNTQLVSRHTVICGHFQEASHDDLGQVLAHSWKV